MKFTTEYIIMCKQNFEFFSDAIRFAEHHGYIPEEEAYRYTLEAHIVQV